MKSDAKRFGAKLKSMRQKKGAGLRELARNTQMSPAYLSKIEAGKEKPPTEKRIRVLAKALSCDEDHMLALAGRVPCDVLRTIQRHPCEYFALIRAAKNLNAEQLTRLQQRLANGEKL